LALAGIESAKIEILSSKDASYVYINEENKLVFEGSDENPVREGTLDRGTFSYTIIDEDSKLNINSISLEQLKFVLSNTGLEMDEVDIIADSIFDWRDTNDLHMLNGAEEDYYQSLDPPYSCKDGPFDSVEELLLVRGVNPEIFYGTKGTEKQEDEEEKEYSGLMQYFTAVDINTKSVNINTASREVMDTVFDTQTAENIIMQREDGPIISPISSGTVKSSFFTVISTGTSIDGKIKRSIRTTFQKQGSKLKILNWNDNFIG
jgi:general secretion pathway protein K